MQGNAAAAPEPGRTGERIGVLGGTFDPVHDAHLALAEEVYHELRLTRVLFVPAGQPPHKMGYAVTPVEQRLEMLELAIAGNPHFAISLVDVERQGPSYTVETLRLLRAGLMTGDELYFIIGGDSLRDLPTWHDPEGILAQATLVAIMRPGYAALGELETALAARLPGLCERLIALEGPRMEISATDLRKRVAEGRPIRYQTPEAVVTYIQEHRLYRSLSEQEKRRPAHAHPAPSI